MRPNSLLNIVDQGEQFPLLTSNDPGIENAKYLSHQLITYIGNKRALLDHIGHAVEKIKTRSGKSHLRIWDAFSGSGIVSRFFKAHASYLASNDMEYYAAIIARCYLQNRNSFDFASVAEIVSEFNNKVDTEPYPQGFIEELYAPKNEEAITKEDRVFYTKNNAKRLDNYCRLIKSVPHNLKDSLLGPLLSAASIHVNTAGVFKGFYKNRYTGIGQFGGSGTDALSRITRTIKLEAPVLSNHECEYDVFNEDANIVVRKLKGLDMAYIDPPYNQHPYGSNYFMLNLLAKYERPACMSRVSGIPVDWQRSGYNVRSKALPLLRNLLESIDAPFLLVSFNNEGYISPEEMHSMLNQIGSVDTIEIQYNTFRGSRNLNNRPVHVTEQLFLVERR